MTYSFGEFVGVDTKNVAVSVCSWRSCVTEKSHQSIVTLRIIIEVAVSEVSDLAVIS
jgi:hypothetical protein